MGGVSRSEYIFYSVASSCFFPRAEVGLLSHNVIVQGTRLEDPNGFEGLGADLYGAHILIHRMGPHPTPVRYGVALQY